MSLSAATAEDVRKMLRDKFPAAHTGRYSGRHATQQPGWGQNPSTGFYREGDQSAEGLASLQLAQKQTTLNLSPQERAQRLSEGLTREGSIHEIVVDSGAIGFGHNLRDILRSNRWQVKAYVDASDSFDPQSFGDEVCDSMLWLRYSQATERGSARESLKKESPLWKALDWLLADGNVGLVLFDIRGVFEVEDTVESRQLGSLGYRQVNTFGSQQPHRPPSVPLSIWYRLRQRAETSGAVLAIITAQSIVPCAWQRHQYSASDIPVSSPSVAVGGGKVHHSTESPQTVSSIEHLGGRGR